MRLFPPWHTPEEVGKALIEGLEDGTLALDTEEEQEPLVSPESGEKYKPLSAVRELPAATTAG